MSFKQYFNEAGTSAMVKWWDNLKQSNPQLYTKRREEYKAKMREYNRKKLDALKPDRKRKPESPSGLVHPPVPRTIQSAQWWRDLKTQKPEEFARRKAIIAQRVRERRALAKKVHLKE